MLLAFGVERHLQHLQHVRLAMSGLEAHVVAAQAPVVARAVEHVAHGERGRQAEVGRDGRRAPSWVLCGSMFTTVEDDVVDSWTFT